MAFDYSWIIHVALMISCASFFYKCAEIENKSPWLWTSLSLTAYLLTAALLRWNWPLCLAAQAALWAAIAIARAMWTLKSRPK